MVELPSSVLYAELQPCSSHATSPTQVSFYTVSSACSAPSSLVSSVRALFAKANRLLAFAGGKEFSLMSLVSLMSLISLVSLMGLMDLVSLMSLISLISLVSLMGLMDLVSLVSLMG